MIAVQFMSSKDMHFRHITFFFFILLILPAYKGSDQQLKSRLIAGAISYSQVEPGVSVSSPRQFQTFQRDMYSRSDMLIEGNCGRECTAIEASWNGHPFEVIDDAPINGQFSGLLKDQPAGQGMLIVRCMNETERQAVVEDVGVGDIFVVAGQSNAEGRANKPFSFQHEHLRATAFTEHDIWKIGNDPLDPGNKHMGSVWPLIATYIMDDQQVPVSFITTATGGTALVKEKNWKAVTGKRYINMMEQIESSKVNGVKAILFYQGESDVSPKVSTQDYLNGLIELAESASAVIPGNPSMLVGQIGYVATASDDMDDLDQIRMAQLQAWNEHENIYAGPSTYDLGPLADGVHFRQQEHNEILAKRWWAAIDAACYNGLQGRGPQLLQAKELRNASSIRISFSNVHGQLAANDIIIGFNCTYGDDDIPIQQIDIVDNNVIVLRFSGALPEGEIHISYASGNSMGNLFDATMYNLPVESFIHQSVDRIDNESKN